MIWFYFINYIYFMLWRHRDEFFFEQEEFLKNPSNWVPADLVKKNFLIANSSIGIILNFENGYLKVCLPSALLLFKISIQTEFQELKLSNNKCLFFSWKLTIYLQISTTRTSVVPRHHLVLVWILADKCH